MSKRCRFQLGPAAILAIGAAMLCYFVVPMVGLTNGDYQQIPAILPWSFGLLFGSLFLGLCSVGVIWFCGASPKWQSFGFVISQLVFGMLLLILGMVGNSLGSQPESLNRVLEVDRLERHPRDEAEVIAEALWIAGKRLADKGKNQEAIYAMRSSVNILSTEERQADLLAVELLFPPEVNE